MRYSAFEQAAAEASSGMKEIETQLEQLMAQMDQLKGKRDLLDTLARQLLEIQPTGEMMPAAAATPSITAPEPPVEMPAPRPATTTSSADVAAEMAAAAAAYSARSLREEWTGRSSSDSGVKAQSSESTIRGRL